METLNSNYSLDKFAARLKEIEKLGPCRISISSEQAKGLRIEIEGYQSKISILENCLDTALAEFVDLRAHIKAKLGLEV